MTTYEKLADYVTQENLIYVLEDYFDGYEIEDVEHEEEYINFCLNLKCNGYVYNLYLELQTEEDQLYICMGEESKEKYSDEEFWKILFFTHKKEV